MSRSEIGLVVPNEGLDAASSEESRSQALWGLGFRVYGSGFGFVTSSGLRHCEPTPSLFPLYILNYLFQKPCVPFYRVRGFGRIGINMKTKLAKQASASKVKV